MFVYVVAELAEPGYKANTDRERAQDGRERAADDQAVGLLVAKQLLRQRQAPSRRTSTCYVAIKFEDGPFEGLVKGDQCFDTGSRNGPFDASTVRPNDTATSLRMSQRQ